MKTPIFKLVNWIHKKEKVIYLFVGNIYTNLIKKLVSKSISDSDLELLKNHFINFSLLEKTLNSDSEYKIIYENIFENDTIYTLKNKIAFHIDNINFDHIYLWGKKSINNYELIDILTKIFNNTDKLEKEELNYDLYNLFNVKINLDKEFYTIDEIYDNLVDNVKTINTSLELNYLDFNNRHKFIPNNPLKKIEINNMFLDTNNNYNPIYKYKLDSFTLLKNKIENYTINFINTNDLFNAYKRKLKDIDDDLIINGIIKVYFPYIINLDEYDDYNETYEDTIKNSDKIISEFMHIENQETLEKKNSFIRRLHVKVLPNTITNKFKDSFLNLEGYFNNFTTTNDIPFIIYKKKNNNIYKINKDSLGNRTSVDDYKVNIVDLNKWTQNTNIIRKNEFLDFKIFFKNFNNINLTKYFTLTIFDNGRVDVIYDFKKDEVVYLSDVINTFDKLNNIINAINKKLNIKLINFNKNIFNTDVSFIEFVDFNMINDITFNKVILDKIDLNKSIKSYYPFFDIINDKNNQIYIKFKRINNFFNIDDMQNYIEQNLSKTKAELVPLIVKKYNISKSKAEKEYDSISDLVKLNLSNNNMMTKSKINKGIFILLNRNNQLQIKFTVKNLNNTEDNLLIQKLFIFLSTNTKILEQSNENISKIKSYNNFNNDAQNNFMEKKEIISDDEYEFLLSNSDKESVMSLPSNDENENNNNLFELDEDDLEILKTIDDTNIDEKTSNDKKMDNETKEEEELAINTSEIDYLKLNNPSDKKKYNKLILQRLQLADPLLFKTPYSTHCQSSNKKQPVVITKKEKEYIDEKYPGSYTTSLKTGSDKNKEDKYFYICPKYWCPLSAVSINDEQLKSMNNKCPKGEPAIILSSPDWVKKDKDGKEVDRPRYPFLLDNHLYKNQKKIPCCRSRAPDAKEDKEKNERYITRSKLPATNNRYASLPEKLSKILGNTYPKDFIINEKTNCYLRKGIESESQYALSSLINVIDNDTIKNVGDFINAVEKNMTKMDYIELNNGNTLKLFLNPDFSIFDVKTFELFKKDFNTDKDYLKKVNLNDINKELQKMKEFKYDDNNPYNNEILREFMIFNSFENFKLYLRSNLFKTHEEILQLFTNNYSWLNSKKHNIIIINVHNKNREVEKVELLCSKFINYNTKINTDNDFVFIIKNENTYEPMIRIKNTNSKSKTAIKLNTSFSYKEDSRLKQIIDLQMNNCNINLLKNKIDPIKLYNVLDELNSNTTEKLNIKSFVINMSFKFVGFLLKNNLYIPIDTNILSTNIFKDNDIEINDYIYIQNLTKFKCKLSSKKIKTIFTDLNNKLNTDHYKVKEVLVDNTEEIAILLDTDFNNIIPLTIYKKNRELYLEHIKDEIIFLGIEENNATTSYINNYYDLTIEYEKKLKNIVSSIVSKTRTLNSIEKLKHKQNPFPKNIKIEKITEIINNLLEKNTKLELNKDEKNKLINDIYTKDLLYILRKTDSELKVGKNEIVFNQDDIQKNKLTNLNEKLLNPFKSIENSIEDYISYKPVTLKQTKQEISYKFLTDSYKIIPEYTWKDLLPIFEINLASNDDKGDQNTADYLLEIFSKISKMENKKISKKNLETKIDEIREKDFKDDDEDKEEFIKKQKENIYFEKKFDTLEEIDVNDYEQYEQIYDEKYKYSFYELEKISEILKLSIIIIGNFENKKLTKGHRIYGDGDKYVLLHVNSQPKYDKFNLIVKNTNQFIFEKNELPKKFMEYIEGK
jgi:hypothetical protein